MREKQLLLKRSKLPVLKFAGKCRVGDSFEFKFRDKRPFLPFCT